jgi:hypothetical protein
MEMTTENLNNRNLGRYYEFANNLFNVAKELQDKFHTKKVSLDLAGAILCFLLAKNITTAEAVIILCKKGYTKDALVLVRTVYEAALWVLDMFAESELTNEKAIAFIKNEPEDRKKTLENMLALTIENKVEGKESNHENTFYKMEEKFKEELQNRIKRAEDDISKLEKDYPIRDSVRTYGRTKICKLADNAKLLNVYYSFYWQSSLYAHNRPRSSISFMSESEQGWSFIWGPDPKGIDDVLLQMCHFLWYLLKEFNSYFNLAHDEIILKKWNELEELFESVL